jgi:hypothetical protein
VRALSKRCASEGNWKRRRRHRKKKSKIVKGENCQKNRQETGGQKEKGERD